MFCRLTKAFDRVNYWKLFNQLLSDGVDVHLVKLLAYWYVNQDKSLSAGLALNPSHFMLVMVLSRVEFYLHTFLLGIYHS